MEELPDYSSWSIDRLNREYDYLSRATLYIPIIGLIACFMLTGCAGKWECQKDYPKHKTMSFRCPEWNYNEAYDELHHIYTTRQHEPINVKIKK